jgi:hypothetical protein
MTPPLVQVDVWGVDRVAPALARMATGRRALRGTDGLRFAKLLGTGSGRTFSVRDADPGHWALVSVWDGPAQAEAFERHRVARSWADAATERLRVRLTPVSSRGSWSRSEPFSPAAEPERDGPVASITRARLRPSRLVRFWSAVPPVAADLHGTPGLRLAVGIGEAPVGVQGTFSLWSSARELVDFAYRRPVHTEVVRRTPVDGWYAEELFARFSVLEVTGTHRGREP